MTSYESWVGLSLAVNNASAVPAQLEAEFLFQINELSRKGAGWFAGGEGAKYTESMQASAPDKRIRFEIKQLRVSAAHGFLMHPYALCDSNGQCVLLVLAGCNRPRRQTLLERRQGKRSAPCRRAGTGTGRAAEPLVCRPALQQIAGNHQSRSRSGGGVSARPWPMNSAGRPTSASKMPAAHAGVSRRTMSSRCRKISTWSDFVRCATQQTFVHQLLDNVGMAQVAPAPRFCSMRRLLRHRALEFHECCGRDSPHER